MYRLGDPSDRAEFDRKVENWGAKCYQATVELVDPPRVLTEEMLGDYLAGLMEHVEVDDEEYARQRFVDVFQIGWNIEREDEPDAASLTSQNQQAVEDIERVEEEVDVAKNDYLKQLIRTISQG